jgi:hypothetical protein
MYMYCVVVVDYSFMLIFITVQKLSRDYNGSIDFLSSILNNQKTNKKV